MSVRSSPSSTFDFRLVLFVAAAAKWPFKLRSHSGEVKRWAMVTEQRSSSAVDIVGSCVEIMMRQPRWRWSRMTESNVSVRANASGELFRYF
jgi:hypothetical protein